jgi:cytoskeletal protein RodZ
MRIRAKLNLVFFLLVAGFVLAFGVLLYFNTVTTSLRKLQLESQLVARNLFNLTDRTKALITSTTALSDAVDEWNSARSSFEEAITTFQKDANIPYLSAELRNQIKSAVTDWQPTAAQLTGTEDGIGTIAASTDVPAADKTGLDSIIIKLIEAGRTDGMFFFTLLTTRTKLQNADFASRTFMTKDLSSVESELARRVTELSRASRLISIAIAAVLIVIATLFILRFNHGFGRRLSKIESVLGTVSDRDLTVHAEDSGSDELAAVALHVNSMLEILRRFFRGVQLAARQVLLLKDTLSAGTTQSVAAVNEIFRDRGVGGIDRTDERIDRIHFASFG